MVGYSDQIANVALPSAFLLGKIGAPWFDVGVSSSQCC
jgi:hypothetical protein